MNSHIERSRRGPGRPRSSRATADRRRRWAGGVPARHLDRLQRTRPPRPGPARAAPRRRSEALVDATGGLQGSRRFVLNEPDLQAPDPLGPWLPHRRQEGRSVTSSTARKCSSQRQVRRTGTRSTPRRQWGDGRPTAAFRRSWPSATGGVTVARREGQALGQAGLEPPRPSDFDELRGPRGEKPARRVRENHGFSSPCNAWDRTAHSVAAMPFGIARAASSFATENFEGSAGPVSACRSRCTAIQFHDRRYGGRRCTGPPRVLETRRCWL